MRNRDFARRCFHWGIMCATLVPALVVARQTSHHWEYQGKDGPENWGELDSAYSSCSMGRTQSPIDIRGAKKSDLPALKFDYQLVPLSIVNNGHTIQVNYAAGSSLTVGDKGYTLKQFHFHHPSEEHVNGQGFDMVVHLVHSDGEGHLAVVAVLLQRGAPSAFIDTVWKNIPEEKEKTADVPSVVLNVKDLLPTNHGYYAFAGSLTTPPCSEGVKWFVLKTPVSLSASQLATFAELYPMNARPIQAANDREILQTQ